MSYKTLIEQNLTALKAEGNARHIEAFMRANSYNGCLDHLTPAEFKAAVRDALADIEEVGPEQAEALARTYGP